jgi:uncharacterized protein (TIGR02001 family)
VAAALALAAGAAHAQWGGSIGAVSDYRPRGVSLSDGRPGARASVSYDHASGAFAGASVASVALDAGTRRRAELLAYAGYAARTAHGLAWELGASAVHFAGAAEYDYRELFAGVIAPRWNARVHLAPAYYGYGGRTAYLDVNGVHALGAPWRAFAHAGALLRLDDPAPGKRRARADLRLGVAAALERLDVQLAWVGVQRDGPPAYAPRTRRATLVLGATFAF